MPSDRTSSRRSTARTEMSAPVPAVADANATWSPRCGGLMWSALLDLHLGAQLDDGLGRREAQSRIGHEGGEVGQRHAEVEVARVVGDGRSGHSYCDVLLRATVDDVDDSGVLLRFEFL